MKRATANAREIDANRDLRDPGAGTLRIFLLALIGFALLDWILLAPGLIGWLFQPRVFALDVDGKPTLAFEAINIREAQELCKEARLRADLTSQKSNGVPLCGPKSKLSVRLAEAEEAIIFGRADKASPNPSDDLVLGLFG